MTNYEFFYQELSKTPLNKDQQIQAVDELISLVESCGDLLNEKLIREAIDEIVGRFGF